VRMGESSGTGPVSAEEADSAGGERGSWSMFLWRLCLLLNYIWPIELSTWLGKFSDYEARYSHVTVIVLVGILFVRDTMKAACIAQNNPK
jgi:hypothetical protein